MLKSTRIKKFCKIVQIADKIVDCGVKIVELYYLMAFNEICKRRRKMKKKWRKGIAGVCAAVMGVSLLQPFGLQSYQVQAAEGSSSKGLQAADSVKQDPDAKKFTHKEWTGEDYENLNGEMVDAEDVFGINREDPSAAIIPYQDEDTAEGAVWAYNDREKSDYFKLLSGDDWQLTVVQNQEQAMPLVEPEDGSKGFMDPEFVPDEEDGWEVVDVPRSWTTYPGLDFDFPIYTNTAMPWQIEYDPDVQAPCAPVNYSPVGLYRKTFTVSDKMREDNNRVYLHFQGVESAYYVYVNGREVGYAEDSFSAHHFDITDYLVEGENTLAVKVHKFSDAVWFEDQDMIYDGGIFRDVYLTAEPLVQIKDYTVVTDLDDEFQDAVLDLSVDVRNLSSQAAEGWSVGVKAVGRDGDVLVDESIPVSQVASAETGTFETQIQVEDPKLWSAEDPNLYALILTLKDGKGEEVEHVSSQLGFREVTFTSTQVDENYSVTTQTWDSMKINGQPLLLKGTNRHDTDPFHGRMVPQDVYLEDVVMMKQNNINAIRTSHYSNDDYLYWLCNEYGLYMMGETNMESHAINLVDDWENNNRLQALFYEMGMDRTETAYKHLRNHPSIIMWSIGNEMGYTSDPNAAGGLYRDMIWYFKNNDPTRPVHSEGQGDQMGVDMGSNMYPSVDTVWWRAGEGKIPYVMCEYDHAMGNSVGALKEYWEAVRSADNMLGGFIWDWVDQSRATPLSSLGNNYTVEDKTGASGTASGTESAWNEDAGEGSMNGGTSFSGYTIMDEDEKYNEALSGTGKAFTFEVMVKPASTAAHSVFLSKGDNQAALKTNGDGTGIEFFIYGNGWQSCSAPYPENWTGNWHQIAGTYDQGVLTLYIDGEKVAENQVTDYIAASSAPVGIGYDSVYGRKLNGEISVARIYDRALTQEEIQAQASLTPGGGPDDESVVLWLDYADGYTAQESIGWDYYAEDYAKSNLYKDEAAGYYFAYGGDWGDNPNSNSFCEDGLISPDRTPQPELAEVKYQYQNFWFSADVNQLDRREVVVYNESSFDNLNEYKVTYQLLNNGQVVDEGTVEDTDVAPRETKTLYVPFEMPKEIEAGSEFYLNLSVTLKEDTKWGEAGAEMAYGQIEVPVTVEQCVPEASDKEITVTEEADAYQISGENFSFAVSKETGVMENYVFDGEELITDGPAPNFWRGRVENDTGYDGRWQNAGKDVQVNEIKAEEQENGQVKITVAMTLPNALNAEQSMIYTINGDGQVTVNMKIDATMTEMGEYLRIGSLMTLPEGFENVTWYGNGPVETFNDRCSNARQGIYKNTVTDLFYPYMKVDDTGTMTEVKWFEVTNDDLNNGLLIVAKDTVEASALHFTPEDLDAPTHPYGLSPRKETIVNVNYGSLGTGSATCGPGVLPQYRLPNDQAYEWEFTLMPVAADADADEITEAAKPYRVVDSFNKDEYDQARADEMISKIDAFVVYSYSQLDEIEQLQAEYEELTDSQKELVNKDKDREALMNDYLEEIQGLEGKTTLIMDQSKNGFAIPYEESASFTRTEEGIVMRGNLAVPFNDVLDNVVEGDHSFTVEANVTPTENTQYNMIAGKGDHTWGLRSSATNIAFFIFAGGGWRSIDVERPEWLEASWLDQEHQIAGVYDAEQDTIALYADGQLVAEQQTGTTEGPAHSDYPFTIGACPETGRTSTADFDDIHVYSKALSADEIAGQNAETPAITQDDPSVELWVDFESIRFEEKGQINEVTLDPAEAEIAQGSYGEFTLNADNDQEQITSVDWSVSDMNGQPAAGITVVPDETQCTLARVEVAEDTAAGTQAVLKASNVNGREELGAQAVITVTEAQTVIVDSGKYGLDTEVPDTVRFVRAEDGTSHAVQGYFTVNDPEQILNDAMTGGKDFTVTARVYVPASVKDTNAGIWEGGSKYNMIASLGDDSFAFRIRNNAGNGGGVTIDAYVCDGTWAQASTEALADSFYDQWHTLSAVYETGAGLKIYVDGELSAVNEAAGSMNVRKNDERFSVGYEPQMADSRQSELTFDQVVVYEDALDEDALNSVHQPSEELVALWLDFGGEPETPSEELSTAVLEYVLELAADVDTEGVIDTVAEAFQAAYERAQQVLEAANAQDPSITQDTIDQAWKDLMEAMQYLSFKKGDKTDLEKVIALAEEMEQALDTYLDDGKQAFTDALAAARDVLADGDAMQDDVDGAWRTLLDSMAGLQLKPDKDLLKDLIDQAAGLAEEDYEAEGFALMREALASAQAVFENENAVQEEVTAAEQALKGAVAALVPTAAEEPGSGGTDGNSGADGNTGTDGNTGSDGSGQTDSTAGTDDVNGADNGKGASASGTGNAQNKNADDSSAAGAVKTGDSVNPIIYAVFMAAAMAAVMVTLRGKKRR